ncbi:MAG: ATP-binding cassette domain-containing protein [Dongiaceae bacterium]
MIETTGLSKRYTVYRKEAGFAGSLRAFFHRQHYDVDAVSDLTIRIGAGEIVGFLGPNGAGKTTTLKMLSGLLHPSSGSVRVAGHTPKERDREFLRSIALVMGQKMQLHWDVPATDSFLVLKTIYDIPDADYRARLDELVAMLDLGDLVNRPIRRLSLGERMKCELAAALLHRPNILFLDEPTIGLDVTAQAAIRNFIIDYNRRYGATVLITSHYMADVTALARRVLVIDLGRLVFDGDLQALIERHSPDKILRVQFAEEVAPERLARFGTLRQLDGLVAEISVQRANVARHAADILASLPVADIAIEEPAVEDVIRTVFRTAGDNARPV